MRNFRAKQRCIDCHFFGQADTSQFPRIHREIKNGDRVLLGDTTLNTKNYDDVVNFGCYHGEWRYPTAWFFQHRKNGLLERDRRRKEKCLFAPYQPGKTFEAVEKKANKSLAKRIYVISFLTLIVAAAAIIISVILNRCDSSSVDPAETIRNIKLQR